jgi:hypothetical protein
LDNSLTLTLIIFLLSLSSSHFIFLLQKKQESCPKNLSILVVQITLLYKLLLMNLVASIVADIKETKFNKKNINRTLIFFIGNPLFLSHPLIFTKLFIFPTLISLFSISQYFQQFCSYCFVCLGMILHPKYSTTYH